MSFESLSAFQIILCMVITLAITLIITFSVMGLAKLVANATIDKDRHPDGIKNLVTFLGIIVIMVLAIQLMHAITEYELPTLKNQIQNISQGETL